jgi:hypothetical protein
LHDGIDISVFEISEKTLRVDFSKEMLYIEWKIWNIIITIRKDEEN